MLEEDIRPTHHHGGSSTKASKNPQHHLKINKHNHSQNSVSRTVNN